jgi:amino acid transporter
MTPGASGPDRDVGAPHLERRFGLLGATALNMANMVGVGPFITIPGLTAAMGGPQCLLGWLVGALIVVSDGFVWSELGANIPGSGGSYHFLRESYGRDTWGRLMAFLFIWSFVFSGPLEIGSGLIGFGQYAGYIWKGLGDRGEQFVAAFSGLAAIALLSAGSKFMNRATITLWAGTVVAMLAVLVCGVPHFDPGKAFAFAPDAFTFSRGFVLGLGSASLTAVYNYMGYYNICYVGDEVRDPARVIPRSIFVSIAFCAVCYIGIHLVVLGVVPVKDIVVSHRIVSEFIENLYGRGAALVITLLILWTAFASVFALLLGYSRIPYAAALDGCFFKAFGRIHPTRHFPDTALYVLGGFSIVAAFFPLDFVIAALLTTRVIVQFLGQIVGVSLLRRRLPAADRPYKMMLYPLPGIVAAIGWIYLFVSSGMAAIALGVSCLLAGLVAFSLFARLTRTWPFGEAGSALEQRGQA